MMTLDANNKSRALQHAIEHAAEKLRGVDLSARCRMLGLPQPQTNGRLVFRMLSKDVELVGENFDAFIAGTDSPLHPSERLLALHYLSCDVPITAAGSWIDYRQLPGGQFYFEPFCNRTCIPLVTAIGNDLQLLRERIACWDSRPLDTGDVAAAFRVIGPLEIGLLYYSGNDEFMPAANIIFDANIRRAFNAEDAAALASRICLPLADRTCQPCSGCGLCNKKNKTQIDSI